MGDLHQTAASEDGLPTVGTALFAIDAATARDLNNLLQRLGRNDALSQSGGCDAAIRWSCEQRAEVLIVDLEGEQAPLQAVAKLVDHCDPTCRIIAVGSWDDIDLYRALLRSGVFDYLKKPVQLDLMASTLGRARGNDYEDMARIGRSIAVTACAGGLGTSSVVAGLGQLLSDIRRIPVAVVDFDRRKGDQGLLLGVSGDAGLEATLSSNEVDLRLLQRTMIGVNPRLKLLAQEHASDDGEVDSDHLLNLGATLCQLFNQVIWDLPAGLPKGALEVLRHSEVRILLTDLTVQGARSTQRLLAEVGDESEGQQLLLVCSPAHGESACIPRAQFEDHVERRLDLLLPYAGNTLNESLLRGPLDLDRHPALRQELLNLADLAGGRRPQRPTETGLLGRLKRAVRRRTPMKEAVSC